MLPDLPAASDALSIAQSLLPWPYDDLKAKFLAYKCCGFTNKEAIKILGISLGLPSQWRQDAVFAAAEAKLPEIRDKLAAEFTMLEFVRNFAMVMKLDTSIIELALEAGNEDLSKQQHEYLIKARGQYTPQQLSVLVDLMSPGKKDAQMGSFNFTEVIKRMASTDGKSAEMEVKLRVER
jgi:hypothetical protein